MSNKASQEKETVWIKCRAREKCEGNQATVVFKKRRPGGGWSVRYRCLSCGGTFHVQV